MKFDHTVEVAQSGKIGAAGRAPWTYSLMASVIICLTGFVVGGMIGFFIGYGVG